MVGAMALGSVASSLLASLDIALPFFVASASLLAMMGVVLTFKEPNVAASADQPLPSIPHLLRQSATLLHDRPKLRFPMLYATLVPVASVIMETLFVQPQALAVGVPLAGVGAVVMATQLASIAGSTWATKFAARVGERHTLALVPALIIACLLLLSVLQVTPALVCIAGISFVTAVVGPILLNRMQEAVADDVRATMLSLQSLLFSLSLAGAQPSLGLIADRAGLPAAYRALAGALALAMALLAVESGEPADDTAGAATEG